DGPGLEADVDAGDEVAGRSEALEVLAAAVAGVADVVEGLGVDAAVVGPQGDVSRRQVDGQRAHLRDEARRQGVGRRYLAQADEVALLDVSPRGARRVVTARHGCGLLLQRGLGVGQARAVAAAGAAELAGEVVPVEPAP